MKLFWEEVRKTWKALMADQKFRSFVGSPVTKIVALNSAFFLLWRLKGTSQTFLVKHLAFDRFNIREHRYHTLLTHAFSHFGFFHYLFDMIVLVSFGRGIRMNYGNRVLWWLYLLGAITGGIAMQFGMPFTPMVIPQVGADAPISAMLTFYGLLNLHYPVLLFFFPVKMWVLLGLMGVYSIYEPSKKNLGGMLAGLLVYQLFKVRMI